MNPRPNAVCVAVVIAVLGGRARDKFSRHQRKVIYRLTALLRLSDLLTAGGALSVRRVDLVTDPVVLECDLRETITPIVLKPIEKALGRRLSIR